MNKSKILSRYNSVVVFFFFFQFNRQNTLIVALTEQFPGVKTIDEL